MRNQALAVCLAVLLINMPIQAQDSSNSPSRSNTQSGALEPFQLQDGTPIKLRLNRNVSSADATVGEEVDFEVLEEVLVDGVVVVPKGSTAIGSVTEAQSKRRMGRAGKLEIVLDYVKLADTEKAAVRAVKDAKGGSHTTGMTVGIVATGLLFWPAAPLFLLMHGKDITVPKGAEITAYVSGDMRLDAARFGIQREANRPATPGVPTNAGSLGSVLVKSSPEGAEVYFDGAFSGNAPATLKLSPGQHNVRVTQAGYRDWSRDVVVQSGSEANLTATLEKSASYAGQNTSSASGQTPAIQVQSVDTQPSLGDVARQYRSKKEALQEPSKPQP